MNQLVNFGVALSLNCRSTVKFSYNAAYILCRNKTTVLQGTSHQESIADFYAGKSVFITGGTGFLGKVFIEKLLYSCQDIDKVYILIRDKKGQSTQERLEQMLNNPVFDRVKKLNPLNFQKIIPIIGDISLPKLGIKPEDETILIDKVSVVFHSAATVKFFEPMDVAMNLNFEATRRVIDLSKRMKNLHNFVYISTAYSQNIHPILEERIYPTPATPEDVYKFIKDHNNDIRRTNKFIAPRSNTYTFTKAMAENYAGTCPDLPVTIIRPSLVGATIKEPMPGWLDNWFAMTAPVFDASRGLNHYFLGKPTNKCDVIPVDYVTNLTLIAAAKYKTYRYKGTNVPVYNSASSGCNPIEWEEVFQNFIAQNKTFGLYEGNPHTKYFNSKFMLEMATFLFQKTPAYVSDLLLRLKGEEPRHMTQLTRVLKTRYSMESFTSKDLTFKTDAARALYASLSKADQAKFPCDPKDINWDTYLTDYFEGIKVHILPKQLAKEKSTFVPKNVKRAFNT